MSELKAKPIPLPRPAASEEPTGARQIANMKDQRLRDHHAERELVRWAVDDADARPDILDRASPELFTQGTVRRVYECLQELYLNGRDVNPASLASMVQVKTPSRELAAVAEELQRVLECPREDSPDNLVLRLQTCQKCRLLHQNVLQEGLRRFMANESIDDILDFVSDQLLSVDTGAPKHQMTVKDAAQQVLENILNPKTADMGLRTGLESWDLQFGGVKKDRMYVIGGYTGAGKCLGYGTKVMMYDGTFKEVQDIQVGEQLMGPDSTPRNVLSTCTGQEQMYWIRQNKGEDYRVNESHILTLRDTRTKRPIHAGIYWENGIKKKNVVGYQDREQAVIDISVRELLTKPKSFFHYWKGFKTPGVEFSKPQNLAIDPYYLGVWLGDGTSKNCTVITNVEPEIEAWLQEFAEANGMVYTKCLQNNRTPTLRLKNKQYTRSSKFIESFRAYGLEGNKHIPHEYLVSSREERLALLAGLIDTDGSYNGKAFEITQKRKELAQQITQLARSLGFYTKITEKTATMKRKDGTRYECLVYRITLYGNDLSVIPCKVIRKQATVSTRKSDALTTGIRIEKDIVDTYYGFTIDGDHRFLLSDLTVTHNTAVVTDFIWRLLSFNPGNVAICFFSLEMSTPRIVQRVYSRIAHVSVNRQDDHKKPGHTPLTQNEQNRLVQAFGDLAAWSDQGAWKVEYASISARQIRSRGRRFALQNKGKHLVFILDHIGLVDKTSADNRVEFDRIMDALKDLQRQYGATTIPLIQLKKETESPSNRTNYYRPNSSFIMESVGVEAMADAVILLWRPSKFHKEFPTIPYAGVPDWDPQGKLVGIIAKNRDGAAHNDIIWQANMAFNELGDLDDSGL